MANPVTHSFLLDEYEGITSNKKYVRERYQTVSEYKTAIVPKRRWATASLVFQLS